jgi:hypothetical protein
MEKIHTANSNIKLKTLAMDYRLLVNVNVNKCKGHNGPDPYIDGLAQNTHNQQHEKQT